jgi:hypothetical protein
MNKVLKIKDAQKIVKDFAVRNGWGDEPNIDKFDHVHEELIEMSKHLRYKKSNEMIKYINDFKVIFEKNIQNTPFPTGLDLTKKILDLIFEEADDCLSATQGINLEHKIVMSIAIRIKAEQFMKAKITDQSFLSGLDGKGSQEKGCFSGCWSRVRTDSPRAR